MDEKEAIVKGEDKGDLVSKTKTIYNAGAGEIFWKNFLAGLGRGLGMVFVYLGFLVIMGVIIVNIVLPKILPMITSYTDILKSFSPMTGSSNQPLFNLFGQ